MSTNRILNAQTTIKEIAGRASIGQASAVDIARLRGAKADLREAGWEGVEITRLVNRCVMAFRHEMGRVA